MKILLTGISSFTGLHFARALRARGQYVYGTRQLDWAQYKSPYKERVLEASSMCIEVLHSSFGTDDFCEAIQRIKPDVYCHHGAYTTDYNSPDFPVEKALQNNLFQVERVAALLKEVSCHSVVISSSIFAGHGPYSSSAMPFSKFGEAKWQTDLRWRQICQNHQLRWVRYVIPNPFGPKDNPKLLYEMARQWAQDRPLVLQTPDYVRDNVHVGALAEHYAVLLENISRFPAQYSSYPSGYIESMGQFSERVAQEIRKRTGWRCQISSQPQTHFPQPRQMHNLDTIDLPPHKEMAYWDSLSDWFLEISKPMSK